MSGQDHVQLTDPIEFWEQRHASTDPWRSGGDRGLSPEENYEFFIYRFGKMIELLRRHAGCERPLRILDAGCGRGHFTGGLRRCGHHVTGIDSSVTAITRARESYGPHFIPSELAKHRPPETYDAICCIDVLFHILDDEVWKASLSSLARCASAEAVLLLTDAFGADRVLLGNYIIHRTLPEYERVLAPLGFVLREQLPYCFGSNPNGFAVFQREL